VAQRDREMQPQEFLTFSAKNREVNMERQRVRDMDGVPVITIFESGQGYVMAGHRRVMDAFLFENDAIVVECNDVFPDGLCVQRASSVYPIAHRKDRRR
jgi:hypothetical protein